jgi:hypothetical protein
LVAVGGADDFCPQPTTTSSTQSQTKTKHEASMRVERKAIRDESLIFTAPGGRLAGASVARRRILVKVAAAAIRPYLKRFRPVLSPPLSPESGKNYSWEDRSLK